MTEFMDSFFYCPFFKTSSLQPGYGNNGTGARSIAEDEIEAKSKTIKCDNSNEAEKNAIFLGLSLHDNLTVYNDNKVVCEDLQTIFKRVKWLSRDFNKAADKIGNLRN